jgi:hypothetical protein
MIFSTYVVLLILSRMYSRLKVRSRATATHAIHLMLWAQYAERFPPSAACKLHTKLMLS